MKVWFTGITKKIWENNRSGLCTLNENGTMDGAGKEVIFTARKRSCGKVMFMRGWRGECVVGRGMRSCGGGHAWLQRGAGGMRGCRGACVVAGEGVGYDEIRSMSGRYASYWNAFLYAEMFTLKYRAQHRKQKKNIMTSVPC